MVTFCLQRSLIELTEMLGFSSILGRCARVFCCKNGASHLSASNLTWVIGDGAYLHSNAVLSVNPSPLIHENY